MGGWAERRKSSSLGILFFNHPSELDREAEKPQHQGHAPYIRTQCSPAHASGVPG